MYGRSIMRRVIAEEWNLENLRDDLRRHRLLNPLPPESLLEGVLREGERSAVAGLVTLQRQPASDPAAPPGYFRTVAQIPVTETTFDLLFNGRSGYRAQYYL